MNRNKSNQIILATLLTLLLLLTAQTLWADSINIVTQNVAYHQAKKGIFGFQARPADNRKHPALILIHEWWGLNDYIKENAKKFAKLGYVALAVDLYQGRIGTTRGGARMLASEVRNNMDDAFENLKQAVAYLKNQPHHVYPDRIASIGWCFGGGWSYQMAKNNLGVKASIIYYGRFNPRDDLSKMRAVILGHFAENDRVIKVDNAREFQAKVKTLNGNHEIYIYQNVGHAFDTPGGRNYNPEAAALAWKRTIRFIGKYL